MDALNKISEIIETLSADQKIGDGDYLTVMNSLRDMYNVIPKKADAPPPSPVLPIAEPPRNEIIDYKDIVFQTGGFLREYVEKSTQLWCQRIVNSLDLLDRNIFATPDDVVWEDFDMWEAWLHVFDTYVQNVNLTYGTPEHRKTRDIKNPEFVYEMLLMEHICGERFRNVAVRSRNLELRVFNDKAWEMLLNLKSVKQFVINFHLREKLQFANNANITPGGFTWERVNDKQRLLKLKMMVPNLEKPTQVRTVEVDCYTNKIRLGTKLVHRFWLMMFQNLRKDIGFVSEVALRQFILTDSHIDNNAGQLILEVSGIDCATKGQSRKYRTRLFPSESDNRFISLTLRYADKF